MAFDSQTCIGLIDLAPLTGCFFKGFKSMTKTLNAPCHYFAVIDPKHYEWFMEHLQDYLLQEIMGNRLEVPGFPIPDLNPPASHMEEKPGVPTMKRLVIQKVRDPERLKLDFQTLTVQNCSMFFVNFKKIQNNRIFPGSSSSQKCNNAPQAPQF